jgi:hypothetical protein
MYKYIITVIFIGLLLLANTFVNASEVEVHLSSTHSNNDFDYNENNIGLGVNVPIKHGVGVSFGAFKNSYDDTSAYAGGTYDYNLCSGGFKCTLGVIAGVATGYQDHTSASALQPVVLPQIKIGIDRLTLNMRYMPSAFSNVEVITFSMGVHF